MQLVSRPLTERILAVTTKTHTVGRQFSERQKMAVSENF